MHCSISLSMFDIISHIHPWSHSASMYPSTESFFISGLKTNDHWIIMWRTAIIHSSQLGCKFFSYKWSNRYHNPHRPNICDQHVHRGHDKHSQLMDHHFSVGLEYPDRVAMTWHLHVLVDYHSAWDSFIVMGLDILPKQIQNHWRCENKNKIIGKALDASKILKEYHFMYMVKLHVI